MNIKDVTIGGINMSSLKLLNVNGYDVVIKKGKFLSDETSLWLVKGKNKFEITVPSLEYENASYEFMLKKSIPINLQEVAEEAVEELAGKREQLSYFEKITLKKEFKKQLKEWLNN